MPQIVGGVCPLGFVATNVSVKPTELSFSWSKSVEKKSGAFSFVNQYFLTLGARSDRL